jgi:hypothetical protein
MEETTHDIDITEDEIMRAVAQELAPRYRRPDEMTVRMMMEMGDMGERIALLRLDGLVQKGILKKRKVFEDGFERNAYSPVKGGWEEVLKAIRG